MLYKKNTSERLLSSKEAYKNKIKSNIRVNMAQAKS
jgi:hypothetical protein